MVGTNLKDALLERETLGTYPTGEHPDTGFSLDFKALAKVARRNMTLIGAIVTAAVVISIVVTMLITPKYNAAAQVLIEDQADQIIEGSELQKVGGSLDTDRFLQTQLGILQSRTLARNVVESANLDRDTAFFEAMGSELPVNEGQPKAKFEEARKEAAVSALIGGLSVELPLNSRIVSITLNTRIPAYSAKLANLYAQRYIEHNLDQKYDSSSYARRYLADQLDEARAKVTQSERDLNQYARAAGLIRVTAQAPDGQQEAALSVTNNTLIQLNDAASKATADRISAEDRWRTMSNQPVLSIPEVNSNSAVLALISEKAKAEVDLADERSRHLEAFETVKSKRAQIAEFDRRIAAVADSIKKSAYLEYQAALEKERSLVGHVESLRNEALDEQDRGVQYSVLKRVADTNRALYDSLLSRYNQLNASAGATTNNVTLIDPAQIPTIPNSPRLLVNLLVAFVLGIVIAGFAVYLREIFDDAIRSPEDVENKLGLKLLGLIPVEKDGNVEEELANLRSGLSEAYRSLVTNLRYSTTHGLPKVIAITSSGESEGKSTTSRAIAKDIAKLGKSVLLVDADLRRPTLHRIMGEQGRSGLTDLITGQKSLDQVVASTDIPTLNYLSALPIPPDPALILAGESLSGFIEDARRRYDVIVLDCPPLLGLSDAAQLSRHADGLLFVIDASNFHRGAVKAALRRLALVNAHVLGVVLNRFNPKAGDDDYSYYTYNYYNYGVNES